VVEVISPSTESIDRREKFLVYRRMEMLLAYLIVEQDERRVERYLRDGGGEWRHERVEGSGSVAVPCPDTVLDLSAVYAGT
jgi:Uma2 family endonuclease